MCTAIVPRRAVAWNEQGKGPHGLRDIKASSCGHGMSEDQLTRPASSWLAADLLTSSPRALPSHASRCTLMTWPTSS